MNLKEFIKSHYIFLIFAVFAFAYIFFTYAPWLESDCVFPVAADVPGHISNFFTFKQQFETYHFVYPVEFTKDVTGFFQYVYLPFSLAGPLVLSFFIQFSKAFFSFYMIFYAFAAISFYFLLRQFSNRLITLIFSIFFLFLPLNKPFSVGGNYHFLIGLSFLFLAIAFFYRYNITSKTRTDLFLFIFFSLLLGITYTFSLIFLLAFAFIYLLTKKNFKLLAIPLLIFLSLSYFIIPASLTLLLSPSENAGGESVKQLLETFVLPRNSPISWIYLHETPYDGRLDFNLGLQIFVMALFLIPLLYLSNREKDDTRKFLGINVLTMFFFVILGIFKPSIIPSERFMAVFWYSLMIISAYALSKTKLNMPALFLILGLGAFAAFGSGYKQFYYLLVLTLPLAIYLWLKKDENFTYSLNTKDLKFYICLFALFLLLFPLTGRVETTTLGARTNHFILDGIENFVKPEDVEYYQGGYGGIENIILSCSKSHSIIDWGRDVILTSAPTAFNLDAFNPEESTLNNLKWLGITKVIITAESINQKGEASIQHLVKWFGQPAIFEAKFRSGSNSFPYPLLIFNVPKESKTYSLEIKNPIHLILHKQIDADSLYIPVSYSFWWKFPAGVKAENKDGYLLLSNLRGMNTVEIIFNMFYFKLFGAVSLISFVILLFFLNKQIRLKIPQTLAAEPQTKI